MFVEDPDPAFSLAFSPGASSEADRPGYFELAVQLSAFSDEALRRTAMAHCEAQLRQALSKGRLTRAVKRWIDIVGAGVGLLVLFLPMMVVALAIRVTSGGSVLFKQVRHGQDNRPIMVFKFATMYPDVWDPTGINQTELNDPRVTPLGRFLRKTSIDELPQLWNVLRGEMSLVGPRAHPIGLQGGGMPYEQLCPLYPLRHLVKPGITGLAQVGGFRGETRDPYAARMRLALDLKYVSKPSLLGDLRLLAKTAFYELPRMSGS